MLNFAINVAREAGKILRDNFGKQFTVSQKSQIDLVTEIDLLSEQFIKEQISTHYPRHQILAEEGGSNEVSSDFCWIVDPLDGTTNYTHGYPVFGVSIALKKEARLIVGVVYDPMRDEMFAAEAGEGATLNNRPMRVSQTGALGNALLCTGFPYDIKTTEKNNLNYFSRFAKTARAIRRDGSAALDLCYTAAGRFDGFWEMKLGPWDVAAGALILEESGGRITRFDGSTFDIYSPELLASNGLIHDEMIQILKD